MKTMVYAGTFGTPLNGGRMIGWGKGEGVYAFELSADGGFGVFAADDDGLLAFSGYCPIDDGNPRGFHISPDGRFLVAGLMATGRLAVYPIDRSTGLIGAAADIANVPSVCSVQVVEVGKQNS